MKKELTKEEYYTVYALKKIISEKQKEKNTIEDIIHNIFGTKRLADLDDPDYNSSDWVNQLAWHDDTSVDHVLKMLKITVKDVQSTEISEKVIDSGAAKEYI